MRNNGFYILEFKKFTIISIFIYIISKLYLYLHDVFRKINIIYDHLNYLNSLF